MEDGHEIARMGKKAGINIDGEKNLVVLASFDKRFAPGSYHGAAATELFVKNRAGAVGRKHKTLVLDSAGAQQGLPVENTAKGPLGAERQTLGPLQGIRAKQLRETQVVTNGKAGGPPGRLNRPEIITGVEPFLFVHQAEKVDFAVGNNF